MYTTPKVGDTVITTNGKWKGKVVEVNPKWGWFKVDYGKYKPKFYEYPCSSLDKVPL